MNYQSVYTITPANGATGTWQLDGQMIPNPLSFGAATMTDSVGTRAVEFLNTQIPGASHPARLDEFLADFTRWRLAYASVTIYQDGPDLANQGTVVVCQKPVKPTMFIPNITNPAGPSGTQIGYHHAFHLEASDLPNYNSSQAMPNAYFGKSKEGVYIPLKLTRTHQKWHSHSDLVYQSTASSLIPWTNANTGGQLQIPQSTTEEALGQYPFLSVNDLHVWQSLTAYVPSGTLTSNFCNDNWADFSFRNMAATTSLSLFFRFGFECQLQPTSSLSPHLKLSPEADPAAIAAYFAVSRELKDAYPADYNDLGKIWDVISSIAKTVAPALAAIPVVGPALTMAVPAAAAVGDRIREAASRSKQPTQGSVASATDTEALRTVIPAPPSMPVVRQRVVYGPARPTFEQQLQIRRQRLAPAPKRMGKIQVVYARRK